VATKIQAREIMRIAKRLGKKVVRKHATAEYGCARNVLSAEMSRIHGDHISIYGDELAELLGVPVEHLDALECGFEGSDPKGWRIPKKSMRYYRVGQNVAKLAGLDA
jgi:hypothetical protein